MLRIAEELILFLLDKESGELAPVPARSLRCALAGAVLMDLALEDRIDTDLERLFLIDSSPIGDGLIDPCLASIAEASETKDVAHWISRFAAPAIADKVRDKALDRLAERGILEPEGGGGVLIAHRVVRSRRYPMIDGDAGREVELRIMGVLFSDEIPAPRDVMLIALVDACQIFDRLLTLKEQADVRGRIAVIRELDLIGRSVFKAIQNLGVPDLRSPGAWAPGRVTPAMRARALEAQPLADGGGWPIVGNAFGLAGDPIAYLARQYRRLGPVFRVRAFSRAFTVLAGPDANLFFQRWGRVHFRSVDTYSGVARAVGAHRIVLGMDGREHGRLRKVLSNGYSRTYFLNRVDDAFEIATRVIDGLPEAKPIRAQPVFQHIIAEQLGTLCTGVSVEGYLEDLAFYVERMVTVRVLRRRPGFMMRTPRMRRARARIERLGQAVLAAHDPERRGIEEPDLIDDILALHRADPQFLPESDLMSACLGPFIAGLHTAASIATCMLFALLKHPEAMARVRREVKTLFEDGGPTAEKVRAMDVTHRAAMETLRMYRIAPMTVRTVVNAFEFAGHSIPAGTAVLIAFTLPHVCPEHFPEPERFDIDRYTPDRAEHRRPGVYAPFGLGTHRCLGAGFTEAQLALTLATMLHRAEIAMDPPDYEMKLVYSTIPAPSPGFRIKVTRRR